MTISPCIPAVNTLRIAKFGPKLGQVFQSNVMSIR